MDRSLTDAEVLCLLAQRLGYEVQHRYGVYFLYKNHGDGLKELVGSMSAASWMRLIRICLEMK